MVVEKNWITGQINEQNRIRISILIKAIGEKDYRRMELGTFREGNISVNILDEAGNNIHKDQIHPGDIDTDIYWVHPHLCGDNIWHDHS